MTSPEQKEALIALGDRLRKLRLEKKLSMQKLANLAEIELSQVSRIEKGKANPKFLTLLSLASALEVSIDELSGVKNKAERLSS